MNTLYFKFNEIKKTILEFLIYIRFIYSHIVIMF